MRLTIRAGLTLLYAGSVLLVLLLAAFALRVAHREGLEREFRRDQSATVALIQHQFAVELEEYPTADSAASHLVSEVLFPDREVALLDPRGRAAAPARVRSPPVLEPPLQQVEAPLNDSLAPGWTVRVTHSAAGLVRSTRRLDHGLAAGIFASVFLAGLAGWWLTGRTLAPVGAMAQAAKTIQATKPSGRLPVLDPSDELGRLGLAFNDLLGRLEGALGQQRQFLADAAHELRTPIARVLSQIELAMRAGSPPVSREMLASLETDLERMAMMLDELLQLARADAGEPMSRPAGIYLDDIGHQATAAWRAAAGRRGVRLDFRAPEREVPVLADPALMRRVADVLIDNALRYTEAGGVVTIDVHAGGGKAVLEVADEGIGIQSDERARVFERFFRGRKARLMAPEGSGLGLPIARWIAERHGGTIALLTRDGGGTVAQVVLPLSVSRSDAPVPGG